MEIEGGPNNEENEESEQEEMVVDWFKVREKTINEINVALK